MPDIETPRPVLLVVEDDLDDQILVVDALKETGFEPRLEFVQDGQQLLDYLNRQGSYSDSASAPRPSLILLDLQLPRMDGYTALKAIKASAEHRRIPVVVMTTSWSERDILSCFDAGAASFIIKPVMFKELVDALGNLCTYWFEVTELPPVGSG